MMENHVCDVCRLLDGDLSEKPCGYCEMCDSWICERDKACWQRRIWAAVKRKLEFGYKGHPEYEKVALPEEVTREFYQHG